MLDVTELGAWCAVVAAGFGFASGIYKILASFIRQQDELKHIKDEICALRNDVNKLDGAVDTLKTETAGNKNAAATLWQFIYRRAKVSARMRPDVFFEEPSDP